MNLPTTQNEVIDSMKKKGANENWIRAIAYESGIDFDNHYDVMEPKEFNRLKDN